MDIENRRIEMRKLRQEGYTLEEIGKRFGVSKQRASVIVKDVRPCDTNIGRIVYKGIYELFVNDRTMTFFKFACIAIHGKINSHVRRVDMEKFRRLITGKNSYVTLAHINNILEYIGKPYEEVFELRNMDSRENNE